MDRVEIERLIAALSEFGDSYLLRDKYGISHGTAEFRTALKQLLAEVDRLQPLAAIGDLTVQIRDLDEVCMEHVSNDDEIGADAEGRLVTAVELRMRLIEAYRASRSAP